MKEDGEWELSKENIKPLRQGRQMDTLLGFETPQNNQDKLRQQQTKYELEIRTYEGSDPLGVWYQYIQWIQQNFPKGGPEGSLFQVVHKCCELFSKNDKYNDDERFFEIWMICIPFCSEPLELYNFLYANNIGVKFAQFYINWALELERIGDAKKADGIYVEGINRNAEPIDVMKSTHRQFMARISNKVHDEVDSLEDVNQRQALNALPVQKKKGIMSNRVVENGHDPRKLKLPLNASAPIVKSNFVVLEENFENASSSHAIKSTVRDNTPAVMRGAKENEMKPGKWVDKKIKQKTVPKNVPIPEVNQQIKPNFVVFEEPDQPKPAQCQTTWTAPLSEKKPEPLNIPGSKEENPNIKIMYCKDKIYAGGQEFSFEELRAAKYIAKRKEEEVKKAKQQEVEEIKLAQRKALEKILMKFKNGSLTEADVESLLKNEDGISTQEPVNVQTELPSNVDSQSIYDKPELQLKECQKMSNVITTIIKDDMEVSEVEPEHLRELKPLNSPTVNTKAALKQMIDLFNGTIDIEPAPQEDDDVAKSPLPAFTIYSDNFENVEPLPNHPPDVLPQNNFIFQDDDSLGTVRLPARFPETENTQVFPAALDFTIAAKNASTPLPLSKEFSLMSPLSRDEISIHYSKPFDTKLQEQFLNKLSPLISSCDGYHAFEQSLPSITCGSKVTLGENDYEVISELVGGCAVLFKAQRVKNEFIGLKVQKPANLWEFYIGSQLKSRLKECTEEVDATAGIAYFDSAYIFNNGSVLTNTWTLNGTLLNAINIYTKKNETMPEVLVLYFALELIKIIMQMHKCGIIHGDIKPDNILLANLNTLSTCRGSRSKDEFVSGKVTSLQLIDFGQSIDMKLMPPGVRFKEFVTTEGFVCPEMKDGREWTYQIDHFGFVATLYCMLFGKYMIIEKDDIWKPQKLQLRRYWQVELWSSFFTEWLNIPNCEKLPNLQFWKNKFQHAFYEANKRKDVTFVIHKLRSVIISEKA